MDNRNDEGEKITSNVKGTSDYYGPDAYLRNQVMDKIRTHFTRYGFSPFETPIINTFDLLSYKYEEGAEILDEIYKLSDRGERRLGLRFDLTVPFCKVIANDKTIHMPFRRWEMGHVFRDGPIKAGRAREFYQCDADVVGIEGCSVEAEMIMLASDVFEDIGINLTVKWNNNKLLVGLLKDCGVPDDKITAAVGIVDSLAKHTRKEIASMFKEKGINDDAISKIFVFADYGLSDIQSKYAESQNIMISEGLSEITELQALLEKIGLASKCVFSPTLARGENIYTGLIYEFFDADGRIGCSLGGGGRYDNIIGNFIGDGNRYPAIGVSFGLEPIFVLLKSSGCTPKNPVDVFIMSNTDQSLGLGLLWDLRRKGVGATMDMNNLKFKKVFEIANRDSIRFVVIIGPKEIEAGVFSVKDMTTGEQQALSEDALVDFIVKSLN